MVYKGVCASSNWSPKGPLMLLTKGIELRGTHRPRGRKLVLAAEKGGNFRLAPPCKRQGQGVSAELH